MAMHGAVEEELVFEENETGKGADKGNMTGGFFSYKIREI